MKKVEGLTMYNPSRSSSELAKWNDNINVSSTYNKSFLDVIASAWKTSWWDANIRRYNLYQNKQKYGQ